MDKLVSVIIPMFNVSTTIARCLNSLINQQFVNWECVCVDDGSTDNTEQIVKSIISDEKRIKYFYQNNSGPSVARNFGLKKISGDYVVFLDSDDYLENNYILDLYNNMVELDLDICCCGYTCLDKKVTYKHHDFLNISTKENYVKKLFIGTGGTVCSKMYSIIFLKKNNLNFDDQLKLCEDQLFALKCFLKSKKIASIENYGYVYDKTSDNSLSSSNNYIKWFEQIKILEKINKIFDCNITNDSLKEECVVLKFKSILFNIFFNMENINKKNFVKVVNDSTVSFYLKKVKIKTKSDFIYILPIKLKLFLLVKYVYKK